MRDDEIGFVFTTLAARETGLGADIMIGDETPLVIAVAVLPTDFAAVAAIRRWVMRHRQALIDHWQGRTSSAEMIRALDLKSQRGFGDV
jgi:hypothetical protein